jgi:hypothetical protein
VLNLARKVAKKTKLFFFIFIPIILVGLLVLLIPVTPDDQDDGGFVTSVTIFSSSAFHTPRSIPSESLGGYLFFSVAWNVLTSADSGDQVRFEMSCPPSTTVLLRVSFVRGSGAYYVGEDLEWDELFFVSITIPSSGVFIFTEELTRDISFDRVTATVVSPVPSPIVRYNLMRITRILS